MLMVRNINNSIKIEPSAIAEGFYALKKKSTQAALRRHMGSTSFDTLTIRDIIGWCQC